jgi:uncharacterized protein (TIGR02145 family)
MMSYAAWCKIALLPFLLFGLWHLHQRDTACDGFIDPRDQQCYPTIEIGNRIWFASNLNFDTPGSVCYDAAAMNCEKYGRLYPLTEAAIACPTPWRLPTPQDINDLYELTGTQKIKPLAEPGIWDVTGGDRFTNSSGMSILPAGRIDSFSFYARSTSQWIDTLAFHQLGMAASFWLADTINPDGIMHWHLGEPIGETISGMHRHHVDPEGHKFSIRCVCSK